MQTVDISAKEIVVWHNSYEYISNIPNNLYRVVNDNDRLYYSHVPHFPYIYSTISNRPGCC